MNLKLEAYTDQSDLLPKSGQQIIGQFNEQEIVVYQAFNSSIARDAVQMQAFGGPHYSFNRMSWIKPNFLWMMFRSGWASKANQERILAITITLEGFKRILSEAVHSSYKSKIYHTQDNWKASLAMSEIRLQWDPDHDPYGNKIERRAIQLGIKGALLKTLSDHWITSIEDITDYVKTEKAKLDAGGMDALTVPVERIFHIDDSDIEGSIGIWK